jgi:aryl-alcohol dehydrogenase-like predicted oxidoreductase
MPSNTMARVLVRRSVSHRLCSAARHVAVRSAISSGIALAWATRQPGVAAVIIGPRTLGQLQDNLAGFSAILPPDVMTRLSEISGPLHAEPVTGMGAHR